MMFRCLPQGLLVCALLASFFPVAVTADDRSRGGQVVVVVEVSRPWYVPDLLIERKMRESLPKYRSIPGLRYKVYTLSKASGDFGGIYLRQGRAAADAWFTPAWYRRVCEERGVEAKVRVFETEGGYERMRQARQAEQGDDAVATLVTLPEVHDRSGWSAQSLRERRAPGCCVCMTSQRRTASRDGCLYGAIGRPRSVRSIPLGMRGCAASGGVGRASNGSMRRC
jgi:vacuolar-type H+-ATPase catalytic subunit A/Vma1